MPRFGLLNPHDQEPERAELVQKYMSYMAQQTSIQRRLSSQPLASPISSVSSSPDTSALYLADDDLPVTPRRRRSSANYSPTHSPKFRAQRSPYLRRPSVPSIPELPECEQRIDNDRDKLADINMKIKATLTDLLNCESVKHDERMRVWVQTRLMNAQQSLNDRRRQSAVAAANQRRSSSGSSISSSISSSSSSSGGAGSPFTNWTFPSSVRVDQVIEGESVRKLSL